MSELISSLEPWAELWSAGLWRATWQGAIALAIAWTVARTCTFLSPRVVCWIWRLACVKLLVALVWLEPLAVALLPAEPLPAVKAISPAAGFAVTRQIANGTGAATVDSALSPSGPSKVTMLLFVWLTCASMCVGITLGKWSTVRRLRRAATPADGEMFDRFCLQEARRLDAWRLPELLLSPHVAGPQLVGVWRPAVLLPADVLLLFDEAELRLMLAHELAHLKRRDLAWNWLPTVAGWLFFFHPLVWILSRCWSEAQEAACDELVIQNRVARPAEYGRLLMKLSIHWSPQSMPALATVGVLGSYRTLERRILAMTRVQSFSSRRLAVAAGMLTAVALLGTVPWRLVAQESKQQAAAAAADDSQALAKARHDAFQQLKHMGIAMHNYHYEHKSFPPPAIYDGSGKPLLSWRVAILPYLEGEGYKPLYDKFHLDEPWDSEHNKKLIAEMPAIYKCPRSKKAASGLTVYQVPRGESTMFPGPQGVPIRKITDGTSNTICVVEVDEDHAVLWTRPDDWEFKPTEPARALGGHFPPGGIVSLFADGSAHYLPTKIAAEKLRALFTRAGGEVVDVNEP